MEDANGFGVPTSHHDVGTWSAAESPGALCGCGYTPYWQARASKRCAVGTMEQHSWLNFLPSGSLWDAFPTVVLLLLPVWLLGTLTGLMLPRPKLSLSSLLPAVYGVRHAVLSFLAWQGFIMLRELWYKIAEPGTIRRLCKAIALWVFGQGWHFDFPSAARSGGMPALSADADTVDKWYVGTRDLDFFRYHAEGNGGLPGASPWEIIMEKDVPNFCQYTSWRRVLPSGKTEYKSVTISPDATAEEFIDLYFDDTYRPTWDSMIVQHEVLEHGDFAQRQQVVHWIRRFPFGFISDRQYTIARRLFRGEDGSLYGITKAVKHPAAPTDTGVVHVDVFYSMWRSRTIACPWGSSRPAVETLLLHHEQLKIPENLARFAVRHGMWGFVKCAAETMPSFIAARRARGVHPNQQDPGAFGAGFAANPPASVSRSAGSFSSRESSAGSEVEDGDDAAMDMPKRTSSSAKKLRGLAAFAIAGSLALLMGGAGGGSSRGASRAILDPDGPEARQSLPGIWAPNGKPGVRSSGSGGGGKMRRSVSVASALDSRRRQKQQYRFLQDPLVNPLVHWEEPLTE